MSVPRALSVWVGILFTACTSVVRASLPDWSLEIGSLQYGEYEFRAVTVKSGGKVGERLPLDLMIAEFEPGPNQPILGPIAIKLELPLDPFGNSVHLPPQDVSSLKFLKPVFPEIAWFTSGDFHGVLDLSGERAEPGRIAIEAHLEDLAFDSPDGLFAGLGLRLDISASTTLADTVRVRLSGRIVGGELLIHHFYRDFSTGSLKLVATLDFNSEDLFLPELVLEDDAGFHAAASVRIPADGESPPDLKIRELRLKFPESYKRYLESVASVAGLDGLETQGELSWHGDWSPGTLGEGALNLDSIDVIDDAKGRFQLRRVTGELRTGTASRIGWQSASFEKLDLGSGEVVFEFNPEMIELKRRISVPVFGGRLALDELSVRSPHGSSPDIALHASVENVELDEMTRALGWPEFEGNLSATIPGVSWADGVISVEGALDFAVFGGNVTVSELQIERPFGVLPSLGANMEIENLNLESVTQTFSFGRIAGRLDGYVRDLRLLNWEPVAFDAWLGTPAGDERHDISRQAVRHLTTLGGGSATTMLASPVLRLFNNFSYRRLGLGCVLSNNVCQIRGIEDQGDGILIMQGAGIPKISILAYNRSVDWPQLVSELSAIAAAESPQIGD